MITYAELRHDTSGKDDNFGITEGELFWWPHADMSFGCCLMGTHFSMSITDGTSCWTNLKTFVNTNGMPVRFPAGHMHEFYPALVRRRDHGYGSLWRRVGSAGLWILTYSGLMRIDGELLGDTIDLHAYAGSVLEYLEARRNQYVNVTGDFGDGRIQFQQRTFRAPAHVTFFDARGARTPWNDEGPLVYDRPVR